ncbi:translation initiation factor IF-3 [Candidatus Parcubacteria bacterium]|nr:translation initiation factor IF-3 [Candidatus Parcubacteria bacterium]
MRRTWRKAKPKIEKKFWVNKQIRVPEVFFIDENGVKHGNMGTHEALRRAREAGLDLVEVNPMAKPPVAKVMDYGQFKYDQEKKAHKQKVQQRKIDTKGIRLSVRISKHDFVFRLEQAKKFFQKGHKLKIDLVLKGRERAHPEKAMETINKFVAELEQIEDLNIFREQDLTRQGGRFTMVLINKAK